MHTYTTLTPRKHTHLVTMYVWTSNAGVPQSNLLPASCNTHRHAHTRTDNMARTKQTVRKGIAAPGKVLRRKSTKPVRTPATATVTKRRLRPGTRAIREIRREQKNSHLKTATTRKGVSDAVRECISDIINEQPHLAAVMGAGFQIQANVVEALRVAMEDYAIELHGITQDLAVLAGRETATLAMHRYAVRMLTSNGRRDTCTRINWVAALHLERRVSCLKSAQAALNVHDKNTAIKHLHRAEQWSCMKTDQVHFQKCVELVRAGRYTLPPYNPSTVQTDESKIQKREHKLGSKKKIKKQKKEKKSNAKTTPADDQNDVKPDDDNNDDDNNDDDDQDDENQGNEATQEQDDDDTEVKQEISTDDKSEDKPESDEEDSE